MRIAKKVDFDLDTIDGEKLLKSLNWVKVAELKKIFRSTILEENGWYENDYVTAVQNAEGTFTTLQLKYEGIFGKQSYSAIKKSNFAVRYLGNRRWDVKVISQEEDKKDD
ncbi:hypothetical protein [Lactobacillus sp. LL6]|uniref:hypothetical protein n=1 Tax=Lactobacillus sp. LL6 TaxID=2596827 RepID=UPI001186FF98|nr:hypothetical protein [Lactobacillus sp. LL6]TSO25311.1 hypothetical protein FOD82_08720 [Lactobacillus sp. LL6]